MNRRSRIEDALTQSLSPLHLEVLDESYMHKVPPGAESHFKVMVVSERFADESLMTRHRRVNKLLAQEFQSGLHALAIHAWTPEEWYAKGGVAPATPPCLSGGQAAPITAETRTKPDLVSESKSCTAPSGPAAGRAAPTCNTGRVRSKLM